MPARFRFPPSAAALRKQSAATMHAAWLSFGKREDDISHEKAQKAQEI